MKNKTKKTNLGKNKSEKNETDLIDYINTAVSRADIY